VSILIFHLNLAQTGFTDFQLSPFCSNIFNEDKKYVLVGKIGKQYVCDCGKGFPELGTNTFYN
jgi:hypothetical protein